MRKNIIIIFLCTIFFVCVNQVGVLATDTNEEVFYEDFSNDKLDTSKWLIAEKKWGSENGGVVAENVSISNGILKLEGHGDKYTGSVQGINKPDGKRTGAAIATKEYFGSGRYEVVAKVAPELGACSAIWTFEYEEYYPGDEKYEELCPDNADYYVVNHEIDIEMPGRPGSSLKDISYEYALCNTFRGERSNEYTTVYTKLPSAQNDGEYHTYRFDWHTGDDNEQQRVEYYIDNQLVNINTTNIPTNKGRLWIGIWFPNEWAGTPNFDTTVFEISSVKITPFNEKGDTPQNETYGDDGWHKVEESTNNEEKVKQEYLKNINPEKNKLDDVKNYLENELKVEGTIKFFKEEIQVNAIDERIGTNTIIKIFKEEKLVKEYVVILYGDTNGDGKINSIDALAIAQNKLEKIKFKNELFKEAGRVVYETRKIKKVPNAVDALAIIGYKLNRYRIVQGDINGDDIL